MAKKVKKKQQESTPQHESVLESAEALQEEISKTQELAEKNKNVLIGAFVVVILVIAGVFYFKYQNQQDEIAAQTQLFPAQFYFDKDSLGKALDGDGNYTDGFAAIASNYSSTAGGDLAGFYAGVIHLKKGEYDQAIEVLNGFSAKDYLVQARVYSLIGDAYFEKGEIGSAISQYEKAISYHPNEQFTPAYILKLAFAHEDNGDNGAAQKAYQKILDEYESSVEASKAKKYMSMLAE